MRNPATRWANLGPESSISGDFGDGPAAESESSKDSLWHRCDPGTWVTDQSRSIVTLCGLVGTVRLASTRSSSCSFSSSATYPLHFFRSRGTALAWLNVGFRLWTAWLHARVRSGSGRSSMCSPARECTIAIIERSATDPSLNDYRPSTMAGYSRASTGHSAPRADEPCDVCRHRRELVRPQPTGTSP